MTAEMTPERKVHQATHRAAVDAGHFSGFHDDETIEDVESLIEPHLRAAVAAERERCAEVAVEQSKRTRVDSLFVSESQIEENMGRVIAAAIRAEPADEQGTLS